MSTEEKPSRGNQWFLTFLTSVIALVAITSTWKVVGGPTYLKWAASGLAVVLGLSGLAVLAHAVVKSKFVGTPIEGGLVSSVLVDVFSWKGRDGCGGVRIIGRAAKGSTVYFDCSRTF